MRERQTSAFLSFSFILIPLSSPPFIFSLSSSLPTFPSPFISLSSSLSSPFSPSSELAFPPPSPFFFFFKLFHFIPFSFSPSSPSFLPSFSFSPFPSPNLPNSDGGRTFPHVPPGYAPGRRYE